jgi:hypothetical protein
MKHEAKESAAYERKEEAGMKGMKSKGMGKKFVTTPMKMVPKKGLKG